MRAFAPLLLWCCLALSAIGWDVSRKITAGTKVTFRVVVEGEEVRRAVNVKLDGEAFESGQRVTLGKRTLTIDVPGLEPFGRTFRVWFGQHHLGDIDLKRSRGTLAIVAEPKPRAIRVTGPDLNSTTTNGGTKFGPLLIGDYTVRADFGMFAEERRIEVRRNEEARIEFKPSVGVLSLTAQFTNVGFRLTANNATGIRIESNAPAHVENLPAGEYNLSVWRGDYVKKLTAQIMPNETNRQHVEFDYAVLRFETTPTGAKVFGDRGELGETPLSLREVLPGPKKIRIEKEGFTPLALTVEATANGVHTVVTNLANIRYSQAMQQAKWLASSDHRATLAKLDEALQAIPNDAEALELKAIVESAIKARETQLAEQKQATDQAAAARRQEVEQRAAEQRRSAEQAAKKRFPAETFRKASESESDSALFDAHRWSAPSDAAKVADALRRMLQREGTGWKLATETKVNDETFQFRCNGVSKLLSTSRRHAIVVIGQTEPGTVEIHAKFWDYQSTKVGLSLTQGLSKDGLVPMHPRYFRPADKATVETQRKSVPEDFKTKLFNEMK